MIPIKTFVLFCLRWGAFGLVFARGVLVDAGFRLGVVHKV